MQIPGLVESDFFIGAKINILGRQVQIIDFGDSATLEDIKVKRERSFLLIQPEIIHKTGEIFNRLQTNGFKINRCRMVKWSIDDAKSFLIDNLSDLEIT